MNKLVISYLNFLKLNNQSRKVLSEYDDFFVSITKEEYVKLSSEEKKKLLGIALTDEKHNASVLETKNIADLSPKELKFYLKEIKQVMDVEIIKSFKEKHIKPHCPKNIIKKYYNSKKKGGR